MSTKKQKPAKQEAEKEALEKNEVEQDFDKTFKEGEQRNRVRMQFDVGYAGHPGRDMDGESQTIPDMNLTVRQLLENHTRGVGNNVNVRKPLYLEFPIPVIRDLVDVERYKEKVQEQLDKIKEFQEEHGINPETGEVTPPKDKEDGKSE